MGCLGLRGCGSHRVPPLRGTPAGPHRWRLEWGSLATAGPAPAGGAAGHALVRAGGHRPLHSSPLPQLPVRADRPDPVLRRPDDGWPHGQGGPSRRGEFTTAEGIRRKVTEADVAGLRAGLAETVPERSRAPLPAAPPASTPTPLTSISPSGLIRAPPGTRWRRGSPDTGSSSPRWWAKSWLTWLRAARASTRS